MGKRYHCDYCDRVFADSGVNRKNHFKGSVHQRLRKEHYDAFRDAATILAEESGKLPCKRFYSTGTCDFGDSCKFSHMTTQRRQELEQKVAEERERKQKKQDVRVPEPNLEEWLAKRAKRSRHEVEEPQEPVADVAYQLPPFLSSIPNLPPSLLPPTVEELRKAPQFDWG